MISVFEHPISSGLFGDPEGQAPWAIARQLEHYIAFETALARALEDHGQVSAGMGRTAADKLAGFKADQADLTAGMAQDGLPIPALIRQMRSHVGDAHAAIHTGSTSQDVLDTALSLTLREVTDTILTRSGSVTKLLDQLIAIHGTNRLMGRTRMQAALPITVADRLTPVRAALSEHAERLTQDRADLECLQLAGPVGTNSAFDSNADGIVQSVAKSLSLTPPTQAWQTDRSRIVNHANTLTLITGTLGKFGQDIALMAQQGIDEIILATGGNSSAMPHKSNPIEAELLVTLARFNAAQAGAMQSTMIHEQERSGTAWALEWMVLPQICATTCLALRTTAALCQNVQQISAPSTSSFQ